MQGSVTGSPPGLRELIESNPDWIVQERKNLPCPWGSLAKDAWGQNIVHVVLGCKSGKKEKESQCPESEQRATVKVGCPWELVVLGWEARPSELFIFDRHGHVGHVPGAGLTQRLRSIHPEVKKEAEPVRHWIFFIFFTGAAFSLIF